MTTMPAAVDRLVEIWTAALPDARVDDGPVASPYEMGTDGITTGLSVGWDADSPSIEATLDREQSDGAGTDLETYRVFSTMFKSWGNAETRPLRVAAFADYTLLKAALRAAHPLVQGVLRARMLVVDYEVRPVETGWDGRLRFAVEITAYDR